VKQFYERTGKTRLFKQAVNFVLLKYFSLLANIKVWPYTYYIWFLWGERKNKHNNFVKSDLLKFVKVFCFFIAEYFISQEQNISRVNNQHFCCGR